MSWFRKRTQKALPPKRREVPLIKYEELHKAEDAYRFFAGRGHIGKVVIAHS